MRVTLLKYWDSIRGSFWFVPLLMAVAAIALAYMVVALDQTVMGRGWLTGLDTGSAEGATAILSTIASSMISIAGVVFSMTLVVLSLASSQLGPRLLRTFMTDKTNQMVLGTFVATFLYSLIVLRTIRRADEALFVPHLGVAVGVLLAIASLGVLVYFIHHVAVSIQADIVVARIGTELAEDIDQMFPQVLSDKAHNHASFPEAAPHDAHPIGAGEDGYVQLLDSNVLLALATEQDLVLRVVRRPGHFVIKGSPLVLAWPGQRVQEQTSTEVNAAFALGTHRTPVQDVEFAVNQLAEIAVRALSPGVNDPFTAMACVDRLGAALARLAQREMPSPLRYDEHNRVRVILPTTSFSDVTDAAFDQIRQYAHSSAAVTIRLLEAIAMVAGFAQRQEDRAALRRHAEMISRGSRDGLPEKNDRDAVEERFRTVLRALEQA